jgi:hypothetical protein
LDNGIAKKNPENNELLEFWKNGRMEEWEELKDQGKSSKGKGKSM